MRAPFCQFTATVLVTVALLSSAAYGDRNRRRLGAGSLDDFFGGVGSEKRIFLVSVGAQGAHQKRLYVFPSLDMELQFARRGTFGLFANFYTTSESNFSYTAFQALLTLNLYPFGELEYLWIRLAGGVFATSVKFGPSRTIGMPTGVAMLGWRFIISDPQFMISLGFAGGAQYFERDRSHSTVPLVLAELGLCF